MVLRDVKQCLLEDKEEEENVRIIINSVNVLLAIFVIFRFAEEELAKHQMSASQKWGFDFVRGCPLEETKLFLWERVPPTNEIPEMYALSRAAHIRPIDPDRTPSKKRRNTRRDSFLDLYDELADRSNRYVDTSKNNVLDLSFEDVDGGHTSASSCDEDSFEEDDNNMLCDLNWMPTTSKIPSNPSIISNKTAEIVHANTGSGCSDGSGGSQSSASNHGMSISIDLFFHYSSEFYFQ